MKNKMATGEQRFFVNFFAQLFLFFEKWYIILFNVNEGVILNG